jgi:NAD(P)H-hydrate epimerase
VLDDWRQSIPTLTGEQMLEVDRSLLSDFGIERLQVMEIAGRQLARLTRDRFLGGDVRGKPVSVLAGAGGNGGGALVAARCLSSWGAVVEIVLMRSDDAYGDVQARQLAIVRKMGLGIRNAEEESPDDATDVIIDGMVGYGLRGRLKRALAESIRWATAQPAPVLSLDVPTGMDATTGERPGPAIKASATMTLALPKTGLAVPGAEEFTGHLYLADIGVPSAVYRRLGISVGPIFSGSDLLRLS